MSQLLSMFIRAAIILKNVQKLCEIFDVFDEVFSHCFCEIFQIISLYQIQL